MQIRCLVTCLSFAKAMEILYKHIQLLLLILKKIYTGVDAEQGELK